MPKSAGRVIPIRSHASAKHETTLVPIDRIIPHPSQHRTIFARSSHEELKASIAAIGIVVPLVLRSQGDTFEIVCGERRHRAALALEMRELPAIVLSLDDSEALVLGIQENIQRESLLPIDEARAFKRLIDLGLAKTQHEVAKLLHISQPRVSRHLAILDLPAKVLDLVSAPECSLTERHLRLLASIQDEKVQFTAARKMSEQEMSIAQAERYVARLRRAPAKQKPPTKWEAHGVTRFRQSKKGFVVEIQTMNAKNAIQALRDLAAKLEADVEVEHAEH